MKPQKDRPILNYFKMKREQYPLVITVIGMLIAAMIYFAVIFIVSIENDKPKLEFSDTNTGTYEASSGQFALISGGTEIRRIKINVDSLKLRREYIRGYKDALEAFMLLNLELELKGDRKRFGEMHEILYERYNIY